MYYHLEKMYCTGALPTNDSAAEMDKIDFKAFALRWNGLLLRALISKCTRILLPNCKMMFNRTAPIVTAEVTLKDAAQVCARVHAGPPSQLHAFPSQLLKFAKQAARGRAFHDAVGRAFPFSSAFWEGYDALSSQRTSAPAAQLAPTTPSLPIQARRQSPGDSESTRSPGKKRESGRRERERVRARAHRLREEVARGQKEVTRGAAEGHFFLTKGGFAGVVRSGAPRSADLHSRPR